MIQQDAEEQDWSLQHNRGSLKHTIDKLSMELRRVFRERTEDSAGLLTLDGVQQLFDSMDSDHNGKLDKKEFYQGCVGLGVNMAPREINLVGPPPATMPLH